MKFQFGIPNEEFIKNLKTNPSVLRVFNSHSNPDEILKILIVDIDIKPLYKFCIEVSKIEPEYSKELIEQEYDTSLRIARMASKWPNYEKIKHLYPNLQYKPSMDIIPNKKLDVLYGIIRSVDDPFWNIYYPPNYIGDESYVEPTDHAITTLPFNIPLPDEGFRFNVGKPETFK